MKTEEERQAHWREQYLKPIKRYFSIGTKTEYWEIATMLEDGTSAKLGRDGETIKFETEEQAIQYIKELRGEL